MAKGTLPKLINAIEFLQQDNTPQTRRNIKNQFHKYGIEFYPVKTSILVSELGMMNFLGSIGKCSNLANEVRTGISMGHSQRPKARSESGNLQELLNEKTQKHT